MNILSEEFWINNYNIKSIHNLKRLLNFYKSCNYDHSIFNYTERHHMVPLSIIPGDIDLPDEINLITLSAREHFISHLILSKIFQDGTIQKRNMAFALHMMTVSNTKMKRYKISSRYYEYSKILLSESMRGINFTEDHKHKISESLKGKYKGKNSPNYGRRHSDATKEKMRKNHADFSGINHPRYGKTIKLSLEARRKISENHADFSGSKNPMYGKKGKNSPHFGKKWINNSEREKYVSLSELGDYINNGWELGRLKR